MRLNSEMPKPRGITYHKRSRTLELTFSDGFRAELSAEYLRVFSPSAEVRGHGPGQEVLQTGKEGVGIINIEPVGNYAICLHFDDGHNTGLYSIADRGDYRLTLRAIDAGGSVSLARLVLMRVMY